jgi:hypothetical protein
MLAIADNANDAGVAWPGYPTLARKTRLSTRNIPRLIEHLEASREISVHHGGGARKDTNVYVLLLGRSAEEIDQIIKRVNKGDNLSGLKGGQVVTPDKLSWTKKANKHDTAVSSEPSRTNGKSMNEWMNDPICNFLLALPGYNPVNLEADRKIIVAHNYSVEGLRYLWDDAQADGDNPIGLFLYRAGQGLHAPAFLDLLAERKRQASIGEHPVKTFQNPEPKKTVLLPEISQKRREQWQGVLGELMLEMTRATFDTWVKPCQVYSVVDSHWTIAVTTKYAQEWLQNRLYSTVRRVVSGVTGVAATIEFIVVANSAGQGVEPEFVVVPVPVETQ